MLADLVRDGAEQSGWWIALAIGLFGTAYAGLGVVRALRISHAAAWGIRPERGANPVLGSLWVFVVVTGLLVVSTFVTWLRESSGPLGTILTVLGMAAVYFLVWWRVSSVLPRREGPLRTLVPGAVLVAVGLQCLSLFTIYYLADRAERATSLYGAIGVALTLLLWLYIISRLLVGCGDPERGARPAAPPALVAGHAGGQRLHHHADVCLHRRRLADLVLDGEVGRGAAADGARRRPWPVGRASGSAATDRVGARPASPATRPASRRPRARGAARSPAGSERIQPPIRSRRCRAASSDGSAPGPRPNCRCSSSAIAPSPASRWWS